MTRTKPSIAAAVAALALTCVVPTGSVASAAGSAPASTAALVSAPLRCGTIRGGSARSFAPITDVRVGRHRTFDRFVIQFSGGRVPSYTLIPKASAVFWLDPSNHRVTLLGRVGLKVVLWPASGIGSYRGRTDLRPRFPELREARRIGDFEHVTTWGLGLRAGTCTRVFTLARPARLVIDLPHPA